MCGIVALFRTDGGPVDEATVKAMRDSMVHRGPDGCGILVESNVGLGHRRLSIVDLSDAGHQPMPNEDKSIWLIFNGEIYNYIELAIKLKKQGHTFRSRTDSEVILHLYEEYGDEFISHLDGMFAFVLWDQRKGRFFCARDRIGIKPFYYFYDGKYFACASEIKAFLQFPHYHPSANLEAVADFLYAGQTLGGKTFLSGINELEPGHALIVDRGSISTNCYWKLNYDYDRSMSQEQIERELATLVQKSVHIQCRSDAPLGCHLSGGIDSSTVSAFASPHRDPLHTFSIRFTEGRFEDETPYAKKVSSHIGSIHHVDEPTSSDLASIYETLIWHQDAPMPGAAGFSYYSVSRLASDHVKVALTGHGGDEIFGGYPAQFEAAFGPGQQSSFGIPPPISSPNRWHRFMNVLASEGLSGLRKRLQIRRQNWRSPDSLEDLWIRLHCKHEPEMNPYVDSHFVRTLSGYSPRADYLSHLEQAPTEEILDRVLYHDLRSYLPHLLHKEDRASMAMSIESRVPLLDHHIIEFLATVPPEQKLPNRIPKELLRRTAQQFLPSEITSRRVKSPFPTSEMQWLRNGKLPMIGKLLREERTLDRRCFNTDVLLQIDAPADLQFAAFNVESWFRLFVDGDSISSNIADTHNRFE